MQLEEANFYNTIEGLRQREEMLLYTQHLDIDELEIDYVQAFLEKDYASESLNYPGTPPAFDPQAAIWGAKTLYHIAQLLINRNAPLENIETMLPRYDGAIRAGSLLSADLCLRFLPSLIVTAKRIDDEDPLIERVQQLAMVWHYSGIPLLEKTLPSNWEIILSDRCLTQLYVDRVIEHDQRQFYTVPELIPYISISLGEAAKTG